MLRCGSRLLHHFAGLGDAPAHHTVLARAPPLASHACHHPATNLPPSALQLQQLGGSKLEPFLSRAGVWARMSPDDKRTLMELLGDGSLGEDGTEVAGQVGGERRLRVGKVVAGGHIRCCLLPSVE